VEKARIRQKIAAFVILASIATIATIQYLPVLALLASIAGHGHATPQWCNLAGGCPDK